MAGELKVQQHGAALVLTLSNPGFRNALSPEMYGSMLPALDAAATDAGIRAVVLTGADGFFSAGGNLNRLRDNRALPPQVQADSIEHLHSMTRAIVACPKPVIAAVEGAAAGAGFSMALACDLIVSGASAKFVMAYSKVGLSPDGGGSWFSTRALPRQAAMEMLLEGGTWTAARLHALGVINRVVDDGAALQNAIDWAEAMRSISPHAMQRIKRLVAQAAQNDLETHLEAERDSFVACLHHPDAGLAIDAFLDKRKPQF